MHFEGGAPSSYCRCAKLPVQKAAALWAEEQLLTSANSHRADTQLIPTGTCGCRRPAGMTSSRGGKLSPSHLLMCFSTSTRCQRSFNRSITSTAVFQDIQGQDEFPIPSPIPWDANFQTQRLPKKNAIRCTIKQNNSVIRERVQPT